MLNLLIDNKSNFDSKNLFKTNYISIIDLDKIKNLYNEYEYNYFKSLIKNISKFSYSDDLVDNICIDNIYIDLDSGYSRSFLEINTIPFQFSSLSNQEICEYINNSIKRNLKSDNINDWDLFKFLNNQKIELISTIKLKPYQYTINNYINKAYICFSDIIKNNLLKYFDNIGNYYTMDHECSYQFKYKYTTIDNNSYEIIIESNCSYLDGNTKIFFNDNKLFEKDSEKANLILNLFQMSLWKMCLSQKN